ncbi:TPA: hypothetical protein ACH3X1_009693 [Trebouxia sp. C0004]
MCLCMHLDSSLTVSLPSSQPVRDTPASQPRSAIARFQAERLANLSRVAARASSRLAGPSGVSPQGSGTQMSDAGPATTPAARPISAAHVDSAALTVEQLTDLRPHKKLKVVCWQRLLHLQERQIEKTDQLLVKMDKLVALSSSAAGQNKSAAYSKEQKKNLVKMVNDFMDRHMVSKGFYPSMPDYQACVLHVLGKENLPAAKQNLKEYLAIIEMAQNATRNIKSSITKRVKAEVEKEWTGDGKLYVWSEEKDSVVLDNDFAEPRQILLNPAATEKSSETFPLSKLERQFLDPAVLPYDQISHLTAHQISLIARWAHDVFLSSLWESSNMIGASNLIAGHHHKA